MIDHELGDRSVSVVGMNIFSEYYDGMGRISMDAATFTGVMMRSDVTSREWCRHCSTLMLRHWLGPVTWAPLLH